MIHYSKLIGFASLAYLSLALPSMSEPVIAKVGEMEVKASDVKDWFGGLDENQMENAKSNPAVLTEALRAILIQRLLNVEAEEKNWSEKPDVKAALERQKARLIAESYLRSVSLPDETFPTENDLQKAYEAAGDSLWLQGRYHLAQIFLASPQEGGDSSGKEAELAEVKAKLASPSADFAAIARAHSEEAASAGKGGDLGWLQENLIQPEIRSAIADLKKGQISEPVRMPGGWHIIKVLDRQESRKPDLEEIRVQLSERLREQYIQTASQTYLAELLKKNPVVINEIELPELLSSSKD